MFCKKTSYIKYNITHCATKSGKIFLFLKNLKIKNK